MKESLVRKALSSILILFASVALSHAASATNGTWILNGSGNWSTTANWAGGTVANGNGAVANFSTLAVTAPHTVTLDSSRSVGTLDFGSTGGTGNWNLNSSGGSILTLAGSGGGGGGNTTILVSNNTATLSLPIAGSSAISKTGAGLLVLGGTNTYTGSTTVSAGEVMIPGIVPSHGNTIVGNTATNAMLNVSGTLGVTNFLLIGNLSGAVGALYQTGGTVSVNAASGYDNLSIGNVPGSYGYYDVGGGTLTADGIAVAGEANNGSTSSFGLNGNGIMDINGGTVNDTGWVVIARNNNNTTGSEIGILNVYGGLLTYAGSGIVGPWDTGETAIINIMGGVVSNTAAVGVALGSAGNTGILNLNGGLLQGTVVNGYVGPSYAFTTYGQLNFNGGTLQAAAGTANFIAVTTANIYGGGATINNNGYGVTISQPLLAPSGNGVNGIASFTGGAGYIAPPIVTVLPGAGDTTGTGATALAQINLTTGAVTNVLITCPGINYTATPTFALSGGGASTPATITGKAPVANTSGGLISTGSGNLTLTGANTYTGATVVNSGTLALGAGGSLASSNIIIGPAGIFDVSAISFTLGAGQNLYGDGLVNGSVSASSGSTVYGDAGAGYATNTFDSNLTFVAGARCYFNLSSTAAGANDQVVLNGASSVLTCGGATVAINCGATLDQANDYTLVNLTGGSASISGNFNVTPVWAGTTPANSGSYVVANVGDKIVLHYSTGATNLPVVTNLAASSVAATRATLNGQVLSTGGQFPTVTVYYGTNDGGTNPAAWASSVPVGLQFGQYGVTVSNLTGTTTYYYTSAASNSAGVAWAAPSQSFTTPVPHLAVVTNLPPSNVQGTSAILNGQVVSIGTQTPVVTLYYGTSNGGTNASAWANNIYIGAQSGSYSATVIGLSTNTSYYYTAEAANPDGTAWAQPAQTFTSLPTETQISVLTYQYNNLRNGVNSNETLLVPATVNTNNFGRLITYPADGYVYTQPLYVPNVAIPGQGTHNLLIIATEHDSVYAYDADGNTGTNGGLIWRTNLGTYILSDNGEFGNRYVAQYPDIVPDVGITGTPVIDPVSGTLYVAVASRDVTTSTNYHSRLHALNITNGMEQPGSPVLVTASVPGVGRDSTNGVMTFNPEQENQRGALTLANGIVYIIYAGYADTDPYHGWVIGYNETNLTQVSAYCSTPNATIAGFGANAAEGGVWMSGDGLCVDSNSNIYFETGNGSFSENTNGGDYADSFIKLSTTTNISATNGLALVDYFTPYNQSSLSSADLDLSSAGDMLLPDEVGSTNHPHLIVGGSKGGEVYLLDRDNLGQFQAGGDTQIVQEFAAVSGSTQIYCTPVYFNHDLYFQYRSGIIEEYSISNALINTTPVSENSTSFSGYGDSPVISANGTSNAILWAIQSDAFASSGPTILHAYNATNLAQELYNSSQVPRDYAAPAMKMTTPTVANGKVYVGGQYGISIYGVTTFLATPTISPDGGNYANSVTVSLADATPGVSIYYTLDGTTPTSSSTFYSAPFVLTTNVIVSAVAVKSGAANSQIASASFVNTAAAGAGTGLLGQYYPNTFPSDAFTGTALVRTDAVINFAWGNSAPFAGVGSSNYTVKWTGSLQPQFNETYNLTTVAAGGVRLYVNGQLLINDWTNQTATNNASVALAAQELYTIELDYYQSNGNAGVELEWSSPSTPQAIIPETQLYVYTNPPPTVVLTEPAGTNETYSGTASVTVSAEADAPYNPVSGVSFYANSTLLGTISNAPYTLTATGLGTGSYALSAVAVDGSGLSATSAVVNITVGSGSGQPYGLTTNGNVPAFFNMPTTFNGTLPLVLSATGVFSNTPNMVPAGGLIPYVPNTPLWSDGALKTRYLAVPDNGGVITPGEQITFAPTGTWTFPAGTVFVKTFSMNTDLRNAGVVQRLETRLLVRDINGRVYGVTYKWRADDSDADLLTNSLTQNITITNAVGGTNVQMWYYPSPADCLTCHAGVNNDYVLGVNTRQLNASQLYASTGVTDNELRTLNRLGLLNPAINEGAISNYEAMSALTNLSASLTQRARSYLDANCAQCHQPGGTGITFDARYDTALTNQNMINFPASVSLGYDHAEIISPEDVWRSVIWDRINVVDGTNATKIQMPPLARNVIDTNAVAVLGQWINSLPASEPAEAPPVIAPDGGNFIGLVNVGVSPPDSNAVIYYTLDGSLPTTNSLRYVGPIELTNGAVTVSANAWESGYTNSVAASALFVVQPVYFASEGFTNHAFALQFMGAAGSNYVLEATTNFTSWVPLATNTAPASVFTLMDTNAASFPMRFYRVIQQ